MIFDRGTMDKTRMCEAVNYFGMKSALLYGYGIDFLFFIIITVYNIAWP